GKAVSLDVVLSSVYHLVAVKENISRLGNSTISLGSTEPKRKVTTHGDWTVAWNCAANAIGFVFPHCKKELQLYGKFIQGEFSARVVNAHHRVTLFN
ncbi:hypothetical protein BKA70DRAFT_1078900, partial [Coprinopsis sp. MPI-PUGE-AT-0042]